LGGNVNTWKRLIILGLTLGLTVQIAKADYNANHGGVVTEVLTYPGSTVVLFRINNQPASHPTCNSYYFAFDAGEPPNSGKLVVSRLLLALANGQGVNIGYDNAGNCQSGWIRAHRVG
jgi:hypothetical protein